MKKSEHGVKIKKVICKHLIKSTFSHLAMRIYRDKKQKICTKLIYLYPHLSPTLAHLPRVLKTTVRRCANYG